MSLARSLCLAASVGLALLATDALAAAAKTTLKGSAGASGMATFQDGPSGVVIHLEAKGLAPGWHAIHLHEKGDCSDPAFTSAGGHMNHAPAKAPHGLLNPDGPDMGDLANIFAAADGSAMAELYSPFVSVEGTGGRPGLLDPDGSSLVIHANKDDYATQPIGGAGARVACGVITK